MPERKPGPDQLSAEVANPLPHARVAAALQHSVQQASAVLSLRATPTVVDLTNSTTEVREGTVYQRPVEEVPPTARPPLGWAA